MEVRAWEEQTRSGMELTLLSSLTGYKWGMGEKIALLKKVQS